MVKRKDHSGIRYGRLTAIRYDSSSKDKRAKWLLKCDCGKEFVREIKDVVGGRVNSCGCLRKENTSKMFSKHALTEHPLYHKLSAMKQRCYYEKSPLYHRYGGRGITISKEWLDNPESFIKWGLDNGWQDGLTIERIDYDGPYSPENCCFIESKKQARNKSNNKIVATPQGDMCLAEACETFEVNYDRIRHHLDKGRSFQEALDFIEKKG